ncbi:hypothetical protein PRBEI_2001774100 [Prionailurus iriomotensis]
MRCWVLDGAGAWAVVMFVDLGRSATLPVRSLCGLDSDNFRAIPPLTQPFMLDKGILSSDQAIRHWCFELGVGHPDVRRV